MESVSVVMATKNPSCNIIKTIKSVLSQTYRDFQFVIIDDGSSFNVDKYISCFRDNRIKIFKIEESVGLGAALNYGVSKCSSKYIARIDDDDLMKPERISKQVDYLENNPNVICVGTQINLLYKEKTTKYRSFPLSHSLIIQDLIKLKFSMAHSSILFRNDSFQKLGGYRIAGGGQDLDFFFQMATIGELANINEHLTYYRLSMSGLSVKYPANKFKAYLFALNSIQNNNFYSKYYENIAKTIKKIQRKLSGKKVVYYNFKRALLIIYTLVLGEKI